MPKATEPEQDETIHKFIKWGSLIGVFVILMIVGLSSFYTITSGQEGVLLTWNKANSVPIQPGLHWKIPIAQSIIKFDVRTQKYGVDATQNTLESAASSDLQIVKVRLAVNYHLSAGKSPEIFTRLGAGYEDKVILPTLHEATKAAIAKYKAADLINERESVRAAIENLLKEKLAPYNIIIEQVAITDFDFSDQFNAAIESKVTAVQLKDKAANDLERIRIEAEQVVAKANGDRDAAIAQAQGEAKKVELVQEQLQRSPQYVEYIKAMKWNGAYPTYYMAGGNAPTMLMQLPTTVTSTNG